MQRYWYDSGDSVIQTLQFRTWFGPDAFDATYGYDLPALRQVTPCSPPCGFAEHWRKRYRRSRQVNPRMELTAIGIHGDHELYTITLLSTDNAQLGGWLALPRHGEIHRGVVHSHGYGGRSEPDLDMITPGAAFIWPVCRGLPTASQTPKLPSNGKEHVLVGLESIDSYILGACTEDIWCAATALTDVAGNIPLHFIGGSFGGGVGALALPWDERFVSGALRVPSFGQYDLRLNMPCTGSGESIRSHVTKSPGVREVLRYFDASSAAMFIDIPMLIGCALWDPAVPPPGQFAVLNAASQAEEFIFSAGHVTYPGDTEELQQWSMRVNTFIANH